MIGNSIKAIKNDRIAYSIMGIFAVFYALEVLVNHYFFRTYALDLGAYTNALYDYGHLQWNDKGVFKPDAENLLSDHFDLYLIIFSPLGLIFGQYTLQLLQIVFVLFGSFGFYKLIQFKSGSKVLAILAQLSFLLSFAVFASLSFDYHSNVLACMLLPWVFLAAEKHQVRNFILLVLGIWIAKESMPLMMIFVCLGIGLELKDNKTIKRTAFVLSGLSLLYFLAVMVYIMPSLSNTGHYDFFKYHALGNSYGDIPKSILSRPFDLIKVLFVNHSGKPEYDFVKTETYAFFLVSGAWLMVWRPAFLVMTVPLLVMKMSYDVPSVWSVDAHYSNDFAILILIGAFYTVARRRTEWIKYMLGVLLVIGSFSATVRLMDDTVYWHDYSRVRIYDESHYTKNYDVNEVYRQLNKIPEDAVVSAQTVFVPHLAYRDKCYAFPIVKDAEYIVVSASEKELYPIIREEMDKQIGDSLVTGRWGVEWRDTNVMVLRHLSGRRK